MTVDLRLGDCIEVMRQLPDNSVDAIVTDPPYGLGFMGKAWDDLPPGLDFAVEALRVLKPGGHLLAFGGTRTFHRLAVAIEDAGFEIRDSIAWLYGSGFPKSHNLTGEWEGWGTALKPAFEPIVVARKPFPGTVAANVLAHGTGALNIDATRISTSDDTRRNAAGGDNGLNGEGTFKIRERRANDMPLRDGRWPANVMLDESQAAALDAQTGTLKSGKMQPTRTTAAREVYGQNAAGGYTTMETYGDAGGASRFFYVAKAPKSERPVVDGVAHPTVKPLTLMRQLVRLVTPPGGAVLEPFAGSGATVEAAVLEGFDCIAIEREPSYLPLIEARIARAETEAAV